MNDDWEKNFSSILKDTEKNISSLKKQLHSTPVYTSTPYRYSSYLDRGLGQPIRLQRDIQHSPIASPTGITSPVSRLEPQAKAQTSSITTLVTSLFERVEEQAKLITSLTNTVHSLQYENKIQDEQLKRLQEEQTILTRRFHEEGVDLQTEQKLSKWHREMRDELDTIRRLVRLQKSPTQADRQNGEISTTQISKELFDSRRIIQDETDALKREVDSIRTRLAKLEIDIVSVWDDTRDLGKRHDRLHRDFTSIGENQRSYSRTTERSETFQKQIKFDIQELSTELNRLKSQLNNASYEQDRRNIYRSNSQTEEYEERSKNADRDISLSTKRTTDEITLSTKRTTDELKRNKNISENRKSTRRKPSKKKRDSLLSSLDAFSLVSGVDLSLTSYNLDDFSDPETLSVTDVKTEELIGLSDDDYSGSSIDTDNLL